MRALLLSFLLLGCSSKKADDGPACPKVVDNMLVVMRQSMAGHKSVELANRDQMIAQCEARKMTAKERTCLAAAKDVMGLANCREAKPGALPPPEKTRPAAPAPEVPAGSSAPAGSASPSPTGSGG